MEVTRYREILGELEIFIELGKQVSLHLVGIEPEHHHCSYADPIFTKLLCHAISLHRLSPQLDQSQGQQLWDMPSACAVARCIIEAHDVLEYIALANISEEERSFRLLVWKLHDQQRRSSMLNSINSHDPRARDIHNKADELQKEAEQHPWFPNINLGYQKRIRSGDAPSYLLSQRELNKANGVNHDYHVAATMMLSQYVHTLPMAVHQLLEFKAGTPEALHLSSMPVQYSLAFLARTITRMAEVFPQGNVEITEQQSDVFSRWLSVSEKGVTSASWMEAK
ncbi:hypothetical protein ACSFA2_01870 [Variovorax sp. LT2P21]|uniref:hypothetical protein n=1 Tax=Variovorax sp. LT2P21 TaxID=3443731 RepID=UPI003F4803E3